MFEQYTFVDKLCPIKGQDLTIRNTYENSYTEFLYIAMVRCTYQENCLPNAEAQIKAYEPSYTYSYKYFEAVLYVIDTGFNPGMENPTFSKILGIRATFSTTKAR